MLRRVSRVRIEPPRSLSDSLRVRWHFLFLEAKAQ